MPGTFSLNGNTESRAHWVTYSFGTILGTKGAGSAAKGSKTASNVTNAAKQSVQNTASKAPNVQTLYLNPFGPQHQLAL